MAYYQLAKYSIGKTCFEIGAQRANNAWKTGNISCTVPLRHGKHGATGCTTKEIQDKCISLSTRPSIQNALIDGITGWLKSGDDAFSIDPVKYHIDVRHAVSRQNQIGWQQIFLGRFSWKWSDMLDEFYAVRREPGTKMKRLTGQQWQTVIIGTIWDQWYLVWRLRNGDLHGATELARLRAITTEVHRDLRDLYDQCNQMEPNVQELLFDTLEEHLKQPT
jgi:hypothetical protein